MENVQGVMPVMDLNNHHGYGGWGDGCGMWFMWIIVIFALMGGWGNGFGNRGADAAATFANGAMTRNEITNGFNNQDVMNSLRGIQNGLCDGFYAQNTTMLNGFTGVQRDLGTGLAAVNANINEARFAAQQCCCETNRNIDSLKAQMAEDTCKITTAIHGEAEATRAMITANQMQNLRDRLAESDRALQSANYQISQITQTNNIVSQLRPTPVPAYNVCSPYSQPCYQAGTAIV